MPKKRLPEVCQSCPQPWKCQQTINEADKKISRPCSKPREARAEAARKRRRKPAGRRSRR